VIVQDDEVKLPLEDVAVLLIESQEVVFTSALLARLAEYGAALLVCDQRHLPVLAGFPFAGHSRISGIHRLQLAASQPFNKRCWQAVVRQKIANQAECLRLAGRKGAETLEPMLNMVSSGDGDNVESRAARQFFPLLFGKSFQRGDGDEINSALDYGYAVMRAAVARALAAHGFLLTQGIHHRSELNPFNLADDFLEPLRPLVDLKVAQMKLSGEFTVEHKHELAALLGCEVMIEGSRQSALWAADVTAASFQAACKVKEPVLLKLPQLLSLKKHEYE
jgi:CRISPR-associated protein Cas1